MRFLSVPLSLILHLAAVAAFLAWGFYGHEPEELYVPPVPIEVISRAEFADEISVPETTTAEEPVEEPAAEELPEPEPETVEEFVEPEPEPVTPEPDPDAAPPLPEEEPEVEVVEDEPDPEPVTPDPEPVVEDDDLSDLADLIDLTPDKDDRKRPSVINPEAFGADRDQERIGTGAVLSITEESMLAACVRQNYRLDKTALDWESFRIQVRVRLNIDGTLAAPVEILNQGEINRSGNPAYQAAASNARAAISSCFPLEGLDPARYDSWKQFTYNFRPQDF